MFLSRSQVNYYIFILCCAFASVCNAIGIGEAKVYSYIDEPLIAEIEINSLSGLDPNLLIANLADAKDFVRAGLERPFYLNDLLFSITSYQDRVFIYIRSTRVIQVPYMEFLIELSWPDGHMVKDYTLLIDPPPQNLASTARPQAFSQLAIAEAEKKTFGGQEVDQQLAEQELLSQNGKQTKISAKKIDKDQTSFGDEIVDQYSAPSSNTELVPSVVPEVPEEPVGPTEYEKQLAEFNQQQEIKVQKKQQASEKNILDRVIDDIEDVNAQIRPQTNIKQLADERAKYYAENDPQPHEDVDFNEVLPPAPAKTVPGKPLTTLPVGNPLTAPPTMPLPPPPGGGKNYLYLALILTLLLVAAAIAWIMKKGLYRKFRHKSQSESTFNPPVTEAGPKPSTPETKQNSTTDVLEAELSTEDLAEEIELSSTTDAVAQVNVASAIATESVTQSTAQDLDKFETELEKIDLDQIIPPTPADPMPVSKAAVEDILNFKTEPDTASIQTNTETFAGPTLATTSSTIAEPSIPEPTLTLQKPDKAPPAESKPEVENPSSNPDQFLSSGLRLQDDNATMSFSDKTSVTDNSENIKMKLDLAKKYIEAGDKESARETLREIIEMAKDEHKLEAEILLSSIV